MTHRSVIEVSLAAVDHNLRVLRTVVGSECGICPILKADAYGLGAARIGPRLQRSGADMIAVYSPEQAAELFAAAVAVPVLVLMPVRQIDRADELYRGLICGRLHLTVHDGRHLEHLVGLADRYGARMNVHLEVDTGMTRGGCPVDEAPELLRRIQTETRLTLAGVFTHFAAADRDLALTDAQIEAFDKLLAAQRDLLPRGCRVHAANTCATFRHRRFHKTMIRVGLAWAGYGADVLRGRPRLADLTRLQPAVTWRSRIIQTRTVAEGTGVGYGRQWTTARDSVIGLVPVGYADGFPYALSGPASRRKPAVISLLIDTAAGPQRFAVPVIGAVNMDQLTVDLTDVLEAHPELADRIGIDTAVELISADPEAPNALAKLAAAADVLPHDLLCRLSPRVHRVYVEPSAAVHTVSQAAVGV